MSPAKVYCSAQCDLYYLLLLGQLIGLFPVCGIQGSNYETLRFSWKSNHFIYSCLNILLQFVNFIFILLLEAQKNLFQVLVSTIYFCIIILTIIIFFDISNKWPVLVKKWYEIDKRMTTYSSTGNLKRKLNVIAGTGIGLATVEHGLYILKNAWYEDSMQNYFENYFEHIFSVLPYSKTLGFFLQIMDLVMAFVWNYMDLFIIELSVLISERFIQINMKINEMVAQNVSDQTRWRAIREDFTGLSILTKQIDKCCSNLIVLSFGNNFFAILAKFMHSIKPASSTTIEKVYFVYSFGFLLARTISVCMYASHVHTESQNTLEILTHVSSEAFNIEIERLISQIKVDPPYFSGRNMFVINRSLVLEIAAAVVAYELVVLEFSGNYLNSD